MQDFETDMYVRILSSTSALDTNISYLMTNPPDVQICLFTEAAETNSKYSNSMIREYQTELLSEANNINKHVLHSGNKVTLVTDNSNGCELFECMYKSERYLTAEEKKTRKIQIHGRFVSSGTPQSTTIGLSENGSEETSRFRSGPIQFQVSIWEFSCQLSKWKGSGSEGRSGSQDVQIISANFHQHDLYYW